MSTASLPNPLAPDSEKATKDYGLSFMKGVYEQWVSGGLYGETRVSRSARFRDNRLFAMGKQPMQEYLDILDVNGENSVINLAYDPLPIAIPFLNRIKDRFNSRDEKISANAIDPFSHERKKTARDNSIFKLQEQSRIAALQEASGVHYEEFKEDDPTDENEIDIEYGFNYKSLEEVIMENGIELVFYENDWAGVIKDRLIDDTMNCGYAPAAVEVDNNGRVKIRPIRPENFISSSSEWNDFRDWQFQGEAMLMSIMSIRQAYPGKISEQRLYDLARSNGNKNGNNSLNYTYDVSFSNAPSRPYDTFKVEVICLTLKTLNNLNYEVSTDAYDKEVLDKKASNTATVGKEYIKSPAYDVSYSGIWIVDTDVVLKWVLSENMIKPENNLQEILSPYVIYMHNNTKMGNTPLLETMKPSIKIMQLTWLQQQKIIAAAAPDGYSVNISEMSDITLGTGLEGLGPHDLYKIYKQTGIQYYKGREDDDEGRRNVPIQPTNVPFSTKLEQLMAVWNAEYDKLQRIVGDNNLAAGQITNQATGKEVLQNARQISESASNYIYGSYLNVMTRCAKLVQLRLWDILVYGKKFGVFYYDGYKKALGTDKVEALRLTPTDDLSKTSFDVMIQVVLDDSAQAQLNNDINQALAQKLIEFNDAVDIRRLAQTDLKYASYMMAARIKKRKKEAIETAQKNSQMEMQSNQQAAQTKSQGDAQIEQIKHDNKMQQMQMEQDGQAKMEDYKFSGILKSKVAEAILAKPDGKLQDIPDFIWAGLNITNDAQKQVMLGAIQTLHAQNAQHQQMIQAQQQQIAQQGQGQPDQSEQGIPEGHVGVELPDGTQGHIPAHQIGNLKRKHPNAKILS